MRFSFIDLLFPARCVACGITTGHGAMCDPCFESISVERTLFCGLCRARIPSATRICHPQFPCLTGAAAHYDDPRVRALVAALKFKSIQDAAEPLGELLAHYAQGLPLSFENYSIVPIPLGTRRMRSRGFNQSALVGRVVSEHLRIPMREDILVRARHTPPQSELTGVEARVKNVMGCFAVPDNSLVLGRSILLIDDVITSGATLQEAAQTLKDAGAKKVIALAAAQA